MSKSKRIFLVTGVALLAIVLVFSVICTVIAHSVISGMSDGRVVRADATLSDFDLAGESVYVAGVEDLSIHFYRIDHPDSRGIVLLLHGMHGMDASSLLNYAWFIHQAGYTAIVVDMRAHGKSDGERLSFGYLEPLDVIAVLDSLDGDSRYDGLPRVLYGLSMGGSTAISTAAVSDRVDGLIAVSPFLSYPEQVSDYMIRDGAPSLFVDAFRPYVNLVLARMFNVHAYKDSPANRVRSIGDIPILFAHGTQDTQTAVSHTERLYEACSSPFKERWIVDGADHLIVGDVLEEESRFYRDRILSFLNTHFPGR